MFSLFPANSNDRNVNNSIDKRSLRASNFIKQTTSFKKAVTRKLLKSLATSFRTPNWISLYPKKSHNNINQVKQVGSFLCRSIFFRSPATEKVIDPNDSSSSDKNLLIAYWKSLRNWRQMKTTSSFPDIDEKFLWTLQLFLSRGRNRKLSKIYTLLVSSKAVREEETFGILKRSKSFAFCLFNFSVQKYEKKPKSVSKYPRRATKLNLNHRVRGALRGLCLLHHNPYLFSVFLNATEMNILAGA